MIIKFHHSKISRWSQLSRIRFSDIQILYITDKKLEPSWINDNGSVLQRYVALYAVQETYKRVEKDVSKSFVIVKLLDV